MTLVCKQTDKSKHFSLRKQNIILHFQIDQGPFKPRDFKTRLQIDQPRIAGPIRPFRIQIEHEQYCKCCLYHSLINKIKMDNDSNGRGWLAAESIRGPLWIITGLVLLPAVLIQILFNCIKLIAGIGPFLKIEQNQSVIYL